jgi:hypothetical protein
MSTAVHFTADTIEPVTSRTGKASNPSAGGIFQTRPFEEVTSPTFSHHHGDADDDGDEDAENLKREGDVRHKQEFRGWPLLWLAFQSTGVM